MHIQGVVTHIMFDFCKVPDSKLSLCVLLGRVIFAKKNLFPFPLVTAVIIGDVLANIQSGNKMCLSAITAHLIYYLNK